MNDAPPEPVPSATIILLRERAGLEVLMIERAASMSFGSAHVFPGGKLDPDDLADHWSGLVAGDEGMARGERALRIAAWREMFEETALLPEQCQSALSHTPAQMRFVDVVRASGAPLPLDCLVPFARWITPPLGNRTRYDTHFYLCPHDTGSDDAICDGIETVSLGWISPNQAVAEAEQGNRHIVFPTRAQLHRLAAVNTVADALAMAASYPVEPIHPQHERVGNQHIVRIPQGYGYPVTEHLYDD